MYELLTWVSWQRRRGVTWTKLHIVSDGDFEMTRCGKVVIGKSQYSRHFLEEIAPVVGCHVCILSKKEK